VNWIERSEKDFVLARDPSMKSNAEEDTLDSRNRRTATEMPIDVGHIEDDPSMYGALNH
jgi:hypothetical protein